MVNADDSIETVSRLLRDVLRGVNPDGTSNSYTTYIDLPDEYSNIRNYVIVGELKSHQSGPLIQVNFSSFTDMPLSAQGATSFDVLGATWHIRIDTTDANGNERILRDQLISQVIETFAKNNLSLYLNDTFYNIRLKADNISQDNRYEGLIQVTIDYQLNT